MLRGEFFFTNVAIVPVRAEARDQAEIVTQLLFGEVGEILSYTEPWLQVKSAHDGYEGFIDVKQVTKISKNEFKEIKEISSRQKETLKTVATEFGPINTVKGSLNIYEAKTESIRKMFKTSTPNTFINRASIGDVAMEYLNAPYLWGGRTPFGIDCSGYTQAVLRFFGIELKRDASQQIKQGKRVAFSDKQIGDLAFFHNSKGNIIHVGILLENNKIIHASGRVKVEELNENGIYSSELGKQTHNLTEVRRYLK